MRTLCIGGLWVRNGSGPSNILLNTMSSRWWWCFQGVDFIGAQYSVGRILKPDEFITLFLERCQIADWFVIHSMPNYIFLYSRYCEDCVDESINVKKRSKDEKEEKEKEKQKSDDIKRPTWIEWMDKDKRLQVAELAMTSLTQLIGSTHLQYYDRLRQRTRYELIQWYFLIFCTFFFGTHETKF